MVSVVKVENSITLVLDSATNDTVISLYQRRGSGGTSTLHKSDDSDYQVPTDRKFISNYLYVQAPEGGNTEFLLWDSATQNSATGTKLIADGFRLVNSATTVCEFPCFFEVAAGRYINYQENDAGTSAITVLGVETDA